jgi:Fe-S cluster assembly iron-binding protein IscA
MLTLTETATTVVKQIVAGTSSTTEGGLRIGAESESDRDFAVSVVAAPVPGDLSVESNGAKVYLEPRASAILEDKTLDAEVGENGSVTFALVPQL